jgi:glycosyltransferase involved in cell wall biosynthesis
MLTVIIPVFNEARNVVSLYTALKAVLDDVDVSPGTVPTAASCDVVNCGFASHRMAGRGVEVLFIDDGSLDGTWDEILQVLAIDPRVHAARFRSRRGKASALAAGFRLASGDYIVTLDGDLQDDPQEIPRLVQLAMEGYDVVCGWKQDRCDPWFKIWGSRMFNWLIGSIWGLRLHDHNCGL